MLPGNFFVKGDVLKDGYRNLLVIAFHYPPDNSSTGVLRTLKFSRFLLDHGWRSHVITVPPERYENIDPKLLTEVPDEVAVHRVPCVNSKEKWSVSGRYPSWVEYPDRFRSWYRPAIRKGREIIASSKINAIFSTYPIPTAHRIGLALKQQTGLPWVADFRDPWAGGGGKGFYYQLDKMLENRVVRHADVTIANTNLARKDFIARYPSLPEKRFVTITNGYDEDDFSGFQSTNGNTEKFVIVYPGAIDAENRDPRPILNAVGSLISQGRLQKSKIALRFIGAGQGFNHDWFRNVVRETGLDENVSGMVERIPYSESLVELGKAGLLLVLNEPMGAAVESHFGFSRLMVPAKVYEYLRMNKHFLVLCSEGAINELLDEVGGGWCCSPADSGRIEEAIMQAYEKFLTGDIPAVSPAIVQRFERRSLTGQLAATLDDLVG